MPEFSFNEFEGLPSELPDAASIIAQRAVAGFPEYSINTRGVVFGKKGKPLSPWLEKGYPRVGLRNGTGRLRCRYVHVLMLETFVGPKPPGEIARHKNNNPLDPSLLNLEWNTQSVNCLDEVANGTHNNARKTHCPQGHEYTPDNTWVSTQKGKHGRCQRRECKQCRRDRWARRAVDVDG